MKTEAAPESAPFFLHAYTASIPLELSRKKHKIIENPKFEKKPCIFVEDGLICYKSGGKWSEMEEEVKKNKFRGFFGNYQHSLDTKGRVFIPAKFREGLEDSFMLTKGLDDCLIAYSFVEWDKFTRNLEKVPFTDVDARELRRQIYSSAIECEQDKQGRILINTDLRDLVGLTKDVSFVGTMDNFEIWDQQKWIESKQKFGDTQVLAEKMQKYLYKGDAQ